MASGKGDGAFDDASTALRVTIERPSTTVPCFVISVVSGPDAGRSLRIDGALPGRAFVGTSPTCELHLTDRQVSRRHASLEVQGGRLCMVDLDSTNGTVVGGTAIGTAYAGGGEHVSLGESVLRIDLLEARSTIPLSAATTFGRLVGASVEMRRLHSLFERVAASDLPVIIEGETGTGKEVLAESLHEAGRRAPGPFVVFDCTTVPSNLMESTLFGHERGAFTGATETRRGVFEEASSGTLLIDEIGDLELGLQAKLLRAIERSEVRRVGGSQAIKCDVRVLAATRRDLEQEIAEGRFRDDLFFRLAIGRIELPPLRRRRGDIGLLTRLFWNELGGEGEPPDELLRRFEHYSWPGNVRELYNAVAARLTFGEFARVQALRGAPPSRHEDVEDLVDEVLAEELPFVRARQRIMDDFERRYLERVLARCGGSVVRAAAVAGVARRYFQVLRARQAAKSR